MNKKEIIDLVTGYFKNKDEVEFAYLFGSFVNKPAYHDIDIAFYLKNNFNFRDSGKYPFGYESLINGELSSLLKTDKLDVVLLNRAPVVLAQRIVNSGKLLFDRDKYFRIKIENNIRKEYIDTEHLRKIKNYYLKKRIYSNA